MLSNSFKYFGGWSCTVSGILLFIAHMMNLFGESSEGTLTGSSFVLAAHVILVFALFGIYHTQAQAAKIFALLGMILSVSGTIFVSGIVFVEIAGFSGVNTELVFKAPVAAIVYNVGPFMFVFGMLMMGFTIMKSRSLPTAGGMFLILGTVVFALASFIDSEKLLIEAIGAALTGLGFVFCGFSMVQSDSVKKSRGVSL